MLSLNMKADVARPSAGFRMGASLPHDSVQAVPRDRASETAAARRSAADSAVMGLRPQARNGVVRLGAIDTATAQAKSALQQPTSQKFAHPKARIAALGGGAMGPHPARDPV